MKVIVVEKRGTDGIRRAALELIAKGRELGDCTVLEFSGSRLSSGAVVAALAPKVQDADLVMVPASPAGRDIAAGLASQLGRAYASDITDLEGGDDFVSVARSIDAGEMHASVRVPLPAVVSVRLGAFPLAADPVVSPEVISVDVSDG